MTAGRKTKYKKEYAEQALKLCRLGATDKELANFFNVAESTLNLWKKNHSEFSESLKSGKIMADAEIADKLYHRALGYSHPEVKIATHEGQITDIKEFVKHYPPDPTSMIFWLKNRQPELWKDKRESGNTEENLSGAICDLIAKLPD